MRTTPLGHDRSHPIGPPGNTDDVVPLFVWLGSIGAVFLAGMAADRLGPVLQAPTVVAVATAHATPAMLSAALVALALAIVLALRVIAGPFDLTLHTRRQRWDLRGGLVGFGLWVACLAIELAVVGLWW